jgi:hypothetical protein
MLRLVTAGIAAATAVSFGCTALAARPQVVMYKSPACGCCGLWATHLRQSGFGVRVIELDDLTPIKQKAQVPANLETCHTAFIDNFVIEGHVPVAAIDKLLFDRPRVIGIAVPGMPAGAPGMPSAQPEPFDVVAFAADGRQTLFMRFG